MSRQHHAHRPALCAQAGFETQRLAPPECVAIGTWRCWQRCSGMHHSMALSNWCNWQQSPGKASITVWQSAADTIGGRSTNTRAAKNYLQARRRGRTWRRRPASCSGSWRQTAATRPATAGCLRATTRTAGRGAPSAATTCSSPWRCVPACWRRRHMSCLCRLAHVAACTSVARQYQFGDQPAVGNWWLI
jgi:hypothetical protein